MDSIHKVESKPWISSKVIRLKEQKKMRAKQLDNKNVTLGKDDKLEADENNLRTELEKFIASDLKKIEPYFLFNATDERALVEESNCQLKLYKLQLEHAKKIISDRAYKVRYLENLKTTRKEFLMRQLASVNRPCADISTEEPNCPTDDISAIVVVQLWPQPNRNTKVRLEKEILFRADQSIMELRDLFKCQRDYSVPMDLSENPEQGERVFRGELFKSGFLLIGDTFYNDMRDTNNVDLSRPIIEWASQQVTMMDADGSNIKTSRGIGPFKQSQLVGTKFEDLEFKLGYPYLYMHQGDCEHLFTISDIKYVHHKYLDLIRFPFVTATSICRKEDNLRCYICESRPPHWYTRNNSRLPVDPFFFCESCFYSFNYTSDKKKIGNFQAFLYTSTFGIPDSAIMAANKSTV